MADKFHIAEWYGRPFMSLTPQERVQFSQSKPKDRPCPFRTDMAVPVCSKPYGVCSFRRYTDEDGPIRPIDGERGLIRAMCPHRLEQANTAFRHVGRVLLDDDEPVQITEVGFLESTGNLDSAPGAKVGRIDMILVSRDTVDAGEDMRWCAVEVQAVYFSGKAMKIEADDIYERQGVAAMPVEGRRPDYRSSGPKRLMPQLQIKIPTLRRWGKKMAIIVDRAFFLSMGEMRRVEHLSNCDIIWFIADFVPHDPDDGIFHLEIVDEFGTTLESAIEGLTGGIPVSLDEFEADIRRKMLQ